MRKLLTTLIIGAAAVLSSPAKASALSCQNADCASMGYTQVDSIDCEIYIRCPFDSSYKACVKYANEYVLASCPLGGNCTQRFKVTGCQDGYVMENGVCTPACTGSTSCPLGYSCTSCKLGSQTLYTKNGCASGYEDATSYTCLKRASITGELSTCSWLSKSIFCQKKSCARVITPPSSTNVSNYIQFSDGKIDIKACQTGYTVSQTNGCITNCVCIDENGNLAFNCGSPGGSIF